MLDGRLSALEDLVVPVTDRGFLLGDAVFETMRTYGGRLFALEDHMDRLMDGLGALRFEAPPSRASLADELRSFVAGVRESTDDELVVRVTVTRGSGPRGLSPRGAGPPRRIAMAFPLHVPDDDWYRAGVDVITARTQRSSVSSQDPRIKSTSALNLVLARLEADEAGVEEALLCDASGRYLEATSANLVVLHGGAYHAPRGDDGVLPGVTAAKVTGILDAMGWEAVRGPVSSEVLRAADEVWLTQTTRELIPVARIDGRPVGTGMEGPVAREVRARFRAEVSKWLDA